MIMLIIIIIIVIIIIVIIIIQIKPTETLNEKLTQWNHFIYLN